MKKILLPLLWLCLVPAISYSQKTDTLTGEAAQQILSQLKIDTAAFLSEFGGNACKCIDSISVSRKGKTEITADISECIEKQVESYQLIMKMYASMTGKAKDNRIELNVDKNSAEYRHYYFEIERWLKDSCASLNLAVAANNEENKHSVSRNKKARELYDTGIEWLKKENYEKAAQYFKKAVDEDEKFAFAWDNLGICYRKLEKYDEALAAYNKSLEIDPDGITPLQNIPVVYQYQKKFDKALGAYKLLQARYPNDPEGFYGAGLVYLNNETDYENALQDLCKAYNLYIKNSSPYRVDAEKVINYIYSRMKADGKEKRFFEILEQNNIKTSDK